MESASCKPATLLRHFGESVANAPNAPSQAQPLFRGLRDPYVGF
jgi:hypothetical protein